MQIRENDKLTKEKEKRIETVSNHTSNYEVEDDLENFLVKVNKDNDYLSHPLLQKKQNEHDHNIESSHNEFYNFRNILNMFRMI